MQYRASALISCDAARHYTLLCEAHATLHSNPHVCIMVSQPWAWLGHVLTLTSKRHTAHTGNAQTHIGNARAYWLRTYARTRNGFLDCSREACH